MAVRLDELCQYLDGYLRHDEIADYGGAMNGLQVEGPEVVTRVAAAVDACQTTIEQAADAGAELILVHHGLFWGAPFPLTGARFRRISTLIEKGIAVYSSHLPLDVHPEVGNNPLLVRELGIEVTGEFAEYKGVPVALSGTWEGTRDDLVRDVARIVGAEPRLLPFGPERIERVGVLTGAGGSVVAEAAAAIAPWVKRPRPSTR